jgi:hypothetical protein
MFTFLVVAYVIYAVLSIPYSIWVSKQPGGVGLAFLAVVGQIVAIIALFEYLSSINQTAVAFVLLIPTLVSTVVGLAVGISEAL